MSGCAGLQIAEELKIPTGMICRHRNKSDAAQHIEFAKGVLLPEDLRQRFGSFYGIRS